MDTLSFTFDYDGLLVYVKCYDTIGEDFDISVEDDRGYNIEPSRDIYDIAHRELVNRLYDKKGRTEGPAYYGF